LKFDGFIGNDNIKKTLEKPFHAYIICGPHGSGKHTLAKIMTASLLCTADEKPCMKCEQCKKYLSGNHVDVRVINSEDLKIKDIREAISDIAYKPNEAEHRVFIFEDAEEMPEGCQNVLLKSIEEPPASTVFIFITESIGGIIETVRSRCLTLKTEPISDGEIMKYLDGIRSLSAVSLEQKSEAIAFSDGFIGAAVDFLSYKQKEQYQFCNSFAEALIKKKPSEMIKMLSFKKREDLAYFTDELFKYFTTHLRRLKINKNIGLNQSVIGIGEEKLTELCNKLSVLKDQTEMNVNISLYTALLVSECYGTVWKYS